VCYTYENYPTIDGKRIDEVKVPVDVDTHGTQESIPADILLKMTEINKIWF